MLEAVQNALRLPDLRRKISYTIFIVIVYQFITHVSVPGVDRELLRNLFDQAEGGIIQVLDLLSGGAVRNFSVIANGVYPYITASIILQLLVPIIPRLEEISKEPGGQETNNRYTYYLTVPMAMLQSFGQINIFEAQLGQQIIPGFGDDALITITVLLTMTAGTLFAVWLGERITEDGLGNGISILIFAGIISRAPRSLANLLQTNFVFNLVAFALITLITVVAVVYINEGTRRIPVQYGKRVRGRKMYGGQSSHIPLRVNTAGMIPLIFAQSIITFPGIVAGFFPQGSVRTWITDNLGGAQGFWYWTLYFVMVVGFTYFYTSVMVQNQNLSESLQRNGGFIPGIRPGKRTQDYINTVVNRITFIGALFLGLVAVLPGLMQIILAVFYGSATATNFAQNPANVVGPSGLIIVVGVVIDTMRQLEAQLMMRNYRGFLQ
jgi:preprotein translocase subunit SecY